MKLKLLKFFAIVFVITFAVLNGRFLYANTKFLLLGADKINTGAQTKAEIAHKPDTARLIIEKIGVSTPIVLDAKDSSESIFSGLEKGVVSYPGSPKPGYGGLSIVLGHSSAYPWYKGSYGSVFALIGKLKPGDRFSIEYGDGRTFVYSVQRSLIFSPFTDDTRLSEMENGEGNSVVLISCWPIGTDFKRIAVLGKLI